MTMLPRPALCFASSPLPTFQQILPRFTLAAASNGEATTSGGPSDAYEFTYKGSDGRMKATFEQAFKKGVPQLDGSTGPSAAPWELGYQMSEAHIMWNDDLRTRLLSRVAAEKLNISDDEIATRLANLQTLLPDITSKLPAMNAATLTDLLENIESIPQALMNLKTVFPGANVSKLAVRAPELVLGMDLELMQIIASQLHQMLPNLNVDLLVEENPSMLDVEELRAAMAEAKRIMPHLDIQKAMGTDPQMILSFQRGSQLIPYDPPTPENETETDDDEYAAYYN